MRDGMALYCLGRGTVTHRLYNAPPLSSRDPFPPHQGTPPWDTVGWRPLPCVWPPSGHASTVPPSRRNTNYHVEARKLGRAYACINVSNAAPSVPSISGTRSEFRSNQIPSSDIPHVFLWWSHDGGYVKLPRH
ncbi:hypothetical protein G7046_g2103 [Stylonectria norvegica]|nr:hypothetical protein G7046_g2103 [Stylonectria norvegica]